MKVVMAIWNKELPIEKADSNETANLEVTGSAKAINKLLELLKQAYTWA